MILSLESCEGLSDHELVRRSLENLDYFSCLYQRYEPELLRYIDRLSGLDGNEARDILQESFIKVWRKLNEFDSGLKFSSWLYRIVHNETVSFIRKKKSYGKDRKQEVEKYRELLKVEPDQELDLEERSAITWNSLQQLPLKYREVLILKYFEKMSYEEISDILKIPEGTVAVRMNRAKKMLREIIEKQTYLS